MALLRVLAFDHEGRPVQFDTWLDDLQLYLLSDSKDSVSLFDLVTGIATAPPATAESSTRSQTAQALYDAVVARYSSPATAALGHLLLPHLFPELSAFATVQDLISHHRALNARYCTAAPAEFLDRNQPLMFITLYFIVTHLPDSLRSIRDHFLSLEPTSLTVDLLEQHLLAAETSAVAVGAAHGTSRPPFFERCTPSPLAPSYACATAADVSIAEDVRAASASAKHRSSKGKGGRGGGRGSGGGGGGSGSGGAGSIGGGGGSGGGGGGGTVGGSGGSGGSGGGSGGSDGSGGGGTGSGGTGARRTCGLLHTHHRCFSRLDDSWRAEFGDDAEIHRWADLRKSRIAIFDLDFDAILFAMYALSVSAEGDCYRCVPPDPGVAAAALGASEYGTLPGTAPAEALHTFTLDSGASRCFFRDSTTLTPLPAPVPIRLADPSEGPVVAQSSNVLLCPAVPSGPLSGLHLSSFSTNLRAAPNSSSFPPTTAPLQTLHMDAWGPCRASEQSRERYFLLVVDDYTRYTTVFPLRSKGQVVDVLIPWIRTVRLQLQERFGQDLPVLRLHCDRVVRCASAQPLAPCLLAGDLAHTALDGGGWRCVGVPGLGAAGARDPGVAAGAGVIGGTATTGPGGARTLGSGAAGTSGVEGTGARAPTGRGAAGARGTGTGGARAGGTGAAGVGVVDPGARGPGDTVRPRPYFVPLLQQVLGVPSSTGLTPPHLCPPPDQSQVPFQPVSPLPAPSPYTEHVSRPVSPVPTTSRVPRSRPPSVPGTHAMTLRPSSVPLCVPLPATPESSLPESAAASALFAELLDFTAACRLDYASALVAELASAIPPSIGGECALGTDVLEDRQEDFESLAAALPRFASMLLAPEGDPDAPDIPTPRSYAEAITGPYSSQWQAAMDAEMASWKSTGTYVDEVPPPRANIVDGMWIFRVKRPPGSPPAFKTRYVARGFSQRQGVDNFQTFSPTPKMTTLRLLLHVAAQRDYELHSLDFTTAFLQGSLHEEIWLRRPPGFTESFPAGTQWSLRRLVYGLRQAPREWHDTMRTTLAALGFAPSTTDPSLFLRTDTSLPPFYVLVYVDDLVFATADTEALTLVKSELQKRHTCTDLGELLSYLGLKITQDRARRTITLTQSHMVHQSVELSGPYPELVGCLMYLMTCTPPDLVYPLSLLARYVAPGRHQKVHWDAAKRVPRYLCSTSGMGLVLGGRGPVFLTGHVDASWVDASATQRSSQGYTFCLGSGSISWRSTRSSSFLSSSCEAEVYARAMAAQELRWLTYLLTNLGEQPRSPPVLYQRGQLRLAYVATRANTADVFTKALPPGDHQRFSTMLGLVPTLPHLLTA
ncbi:unnamed protein product [Closterium sp. NIES-53]